MSKLMYFGFHNGIVVDCMGKSDSLALMQKLDFELEVLHYLQSHIH